MFQSMGFSLKDFNRSRLIKTTGVMKSMIPETAKLGLAVFPDKRSCSLNKQSIFRNVADCKVAVAH